MLTKTPKKGGVKRLLGFTVAGALAVEVLGVIASYGVWTKLNNDRDFRLYMYKNHNWVLEGYYGIGEKLGGGQNIRNIDQQIWSGEGKI